MKIGIQTWGSYGDIRPFLALSIGLQEAGHHVTLMMTSIDGAVNDEPARNAGVNLEYVATPVIKDRHKLDAIEDSIFREKDPMKQSQMIISQLLAPAESEMYAAALRLCETNDLVIGHFFHYPLRIAAERTGRDCASVMLVHSTIPTRERPPAGFPNFGRRANALCWWLVQKIINNSLKRFPNRLRDEVGLPPIKDMVTDVWTSKRLNLIAVSPEICRPAHDWPDYHRVCGFLDFPVPAVKDEIPDELAAYLRAGSAPVYMTFGSVMAGGAEQKKTIQMLTDAAGMSNCRAIIQAPLWRELDFESSRDVLYIDSSPHWLVFPQCQAVVHHGGAGVTQSALTAGVPSVVVAHIAEQAFWGGELKRIGVSPGVLMRNKVTTEMLAAHIRTVIESSAMRETAKRVGCRLSQEYGVAKAVEMIEGEFGRV